MRLPSRAAVAALVVSFALSLAAPPRVAAAAADAPATHEVAEGQSLWKIARRYNVSVAAIQRANGLDDDVPIRAGMVLRIPSKAEAKKLEAKPPPGKVPEKPQDEKPKKGAKADAKPSAKADESKTKASEDGATRSAPKAPWWQEKPSDASQTQKTPEERGGENPCLTKDPGWGIYDGWDRSPSMGQMTLPARGGVSKAGRFDVVFHFHGHEPARKEFVKVMDGAVLVGIDLGIGSGAYSSAFASPHAFKELLASVERGVADARGIPTAKARKIALSAWSAGYGAVEQILQQPLGNQVDAVFLLDGLHAGYAPGGGPSELQLAPFLDFARKAKAGSRFMFVSHSSIIPPGYVSTTETANWLVMKLGGKPKDIKRGSGPLGLEMNQRWDAGGFHVRGYDGNDKMDHCAHLGLLKDVLRVHVKPRWQSPKGQGPKPQGRQEKARQEKAEISDRPRSAPRGV